MSTLKTSNIQDTSGNNNSTPAEISQGRAKAWVNFDGTFSTSPFTTANGGIRDAYNVTSVTDNSTGNYTVSFTNNMSNSNYAAVATVGGGTISNYSESTQLINFSTSGVQVLVSSDGSAGATYTVQNAATVSLIVFGD